MVSPEDRVRRQTPRSMRPPGLLVAPARHPVLLVNPVSGGGKAERFDLVQQCRARGIEAVVLRPGDDLAGLVADAVARGADVIGMAGGDGSQRAVAEVVARHGRAMVVVPSGTRNHLAMDLGLDRADIVAALDAFGAARERLVDLGDVNGRVFVNNVSLGLYAQIVRSPAYREAKVETTLDILPDLLGPGSRPFSLRFTDPAGHLHTVAHVVQVSNNAYGRTPLTIASRPRLDGGLLGVIVVELPDPSALRAFVLAGAAGRQEHVPGLLAWEAPTFHVDAPAPVDVGIDGEALQMAPPLRFAIRPAALRIRCPEHAVGLSPAAREVRVVSTMRRLAAGDPKGGRRSNDSST